MKKNCVFWNFLYLTAKNLLAAAACVFIYIAVMAGVYWSIENAAWIIYIFCIVLSTAFVGVAGALLAICIKEQIEENISTAKDKCGSKHA